MVQYLYFFNALHPLPIPRATQGRGGGEIYKMKYLYNNFNSIWTPCPTLRGLRTPRYAGKGRRENLQDEIFIH